MNRLFANFLVLFSPLVSTAGAVALITGFVQADEPPEIIPLKDQSTEALIGQLDEAPRANWATFIDVTPNYAAVLQDYEAVLQELIKREGSGIAQALRANLRTTSEHPEAARKQLEAMKPDDECWRKQLAVVSNLEHNLERLTALRRVQHEPDPLQIIVTIPPTAKAETRSLPVLKVALKNQDVEKLPVWVQREKSGDSRWRIHVWDHDGKLLPVRHDAGIGHGGGWWGPLEFGNTSDKELSMSDFVNLRVPGEYKFQVLYHDEILIAHIKDVALLEHLIVLKSEPFTLHVEHGPNIPIDLQPGSMQQARALIDKLDGSQKLRMVLGKYTDNFHKFLDPKSAQGELLTMGWQAVPALLDSLLDEKLSFRKRAWLVTLLYSITEERGFDPRSVHGILPNCEWQEAGGSGSRGYFFDRYRFDQKSVDKQQEFARAWLRFRDDYIVIKSGD